jgi:hypothetical protein
VSRTIAASLRSYAVTGLTNGTVYTFRVRAMTAFGLGTPDVISGTPTAPPSAVGGLTASAPNTGAVTLTWVAPVALGGNTITGYRIEICTAGCSGTSPTFTVLTTTAAATLTYTVAAGTSGLVNGTSALFRIAATYSLNAATAFGTTATIAATPATLPGQPTGPVLPITPNTGSDTYGSAITADSPLLWWRLNNPAASTAITDSSGNNNTGTVTGAVTFSGTGNPAFTGPNEGSAAFPGGAAPTTAVAGTGSIQTPTTAALRLSTFTIELWARLLGGSRQCGNDESQLRALREWRWSALPFELLGNDSPTVED